MSQQTYEGIQIVGGITVASAVSAFVMGTLSLLLLSMW